MPTYEVTTEQNGQRLDKFLVTALPETTRSQIQKMIKNGDVSVNGEKPSVHHFLKTGDTITLDNNKSTSEQASVPAMVVKKSTRVPTKPVPSYNGMDVRKFHLDIITDTPDYLIVNKPAGLLVHDAPGHDETTLVDLVLEKYPAIAKIGEDPERPGIVHRLDREVSGLLVIAKTQAMFDHLKSQFKARQVRKEYTALVYGVPAKLEGEIDFNINRSNSGHRMVAVPRSAEETDETPGRKATTRFEVLQHFPQYTLLKLSPLSGRTHQIRVHLYAYGLPIVGDRLYRQKKVKHKFTIDRIFLHATSLSFTDLSGTRQSYELPLPSALRQILEKLKQ